MDIRQTKPARCRRYVPQASSLPCILAGLLVPMLALANPPNVLANRQRLAQQDLSIRGSGYAGAGISINGLNLKGPYSAHYNSEILFPEHLLSAPETQTGLNNISGYPAGTAAYSTMPQDQQLQTSIRIGTKEQYEVGLYGQTELLGAFFEWEKARRIDYDANDLDRQNGGAYLQAVKDDWRFDLIAAHQQKEFGAQGYYGIPFDIFAEDRLKDTLLFLGATHGETDGAYFRASGAWRQFDNEYRIPGAGFASDVRSRFGAAVIEGRTLEIQNISLNLRGDIEHEEIDGDAGNHDRTHGSVLILPQFSYEHFKVTAGLNSVFQTSESAEWLPQAGIEWLASDNSTLYASYSEHVHQPDFQTLYYSDPYHINNMSLQLQRSQNAELGLRQFVSASLDWRAAAFHRRIENATDWTKSSAVDVAWTATDLGELDVFGVESEISFYPSAALELTAYYQWIEKDALDVYAGLYELDYPEHMLNFAGRWQVTPEFELFAVQTLRYQTENKFRSGSDFGADASVGLHWLPPCDHTVRLSLMVDNLWDSDFQAIPGLKPVGQTVSTSITLMW